MREELETYRDIHESFQSTGSVICVFSPFNMSCELKEITTDEDCTSLEFSTGQ